MIAFSVELACTTLACFVVLFLRLRDHSSLVRKYTLHVLNRLILNDMVKLKGQISELASCVIDEDKEISSLAQKIFSDLSRKVTYSFSIC